MNVLYILALLLLIIFILLYYISNRKFNYWKVRNVPYVKPLPFLGNYAKYILQQEYPGHVVQKLCQKFPDQPYFGAFYGTEPVLIPRSPEMIKQVLTKDFYYFNGRETCNYTQKEVVTRNIFFESGDKWKVVRQNLTPLFSSTKMKSMFRLIEKCSYTFEDMLNRENSICDVLEAKQICAQYTMDCICSCAFGVEANTMAPDTSNPFRILANEIFEASNYRGFKMVFRAIWPRVFYLFGFHQFPSTIDAFFSQLLKGVFQSRGYKPTSRNDFVDQVLTFKQNDRISGDSMSNWKTGADKKVHLKVDDDLLAAQSIVFFGAGFDTSASTMSFTLFEFAKNQESQRRAAEEVDEFLRRHVNKLNYDCVNELPYLDACVHETFRMYPVLGNLTREVMDDYVLPSGSKIDAGVRVHIPVYYMHHNPEYFPEPDKYKPERFLPENINDVKPYTYFPFGEGPRKCIGERFGTMQVMAGLVTLLKSYRVELAEGMPATFSFDPRAILLQPRDQGLMLKLIKRDDWETRKFYRDLND